MKLPNFFIVGAPKAGTTSLYAYLDQHPQIFMSPIKEPNFFASELRPESFAPEERPRIAREMHELAAYLSGGMREKRFGALVSSWEDYLKLYRNAGAELAIGEASACYLWSPSAPANIAARIPAARLIINLRNPVGRAYSQYLQMLTMGLTTRSFREQVQVNLRTTVRQFGAQWPLLEFGFYHRQLERYLRYFPRKQLHISLYEDLERSATTVVSGLYEFLGVDSTFAPDVTVRHHTPRVPRMAAGVNFLKQRGLWSSIRNLTPQALRPLLRSLLLRRRESLGMDPRDHAFLTDYYEDDIRRLASLLDRDLSSWLDPSRAAPTAPRPWIR